VKATPNDTSRYPFPSLGEPFFATAKGASFVSEFHVAFPHDKHTDTGCADCHQAAKPEDKGFKTRLPNHATCFTCHNQESELAPLPPNCDACHKQATAAGTALDQESLKAFRLSASVSLWSSTTRTKRTTETQRHREYIQQLFAHAVFTPAADFSQFKHDNAQHARLPCLLCHRRENNSPQPTLPGKAAHAPCTGCHAQQFANNQSPICTICHTDAQSGKVKPFPPLHSFDVRFDHAKHTANGAACNTCHRRNRTGAGFSIPTRLNAHVTCFGCHTPGAQANGRNISSCSTCHQLGRFVRTSEQAPAYRLGFSHEKHIAAEKMTCAECHQVRAGFARGRQVSAPLPLNHHAPLTGSSCASCHNGKRTFGGDDFSVCKRCHKGEAWHF